MSEQVLGEMGGPGEQESSRPQRKYSAKDRKRLLRLFESREVSQKQFARDQGIAPPQASVRLAPSRPQVSGEVRQSATGRTPTIR